MLLSTNEGKFTYYVESTGFGRDIPPIMARNLLHAKEILRWVVSVMKEPSTVAIVNANTRRTHVVYYYDYAQKTWFYIVNGRRENVRFE